MQGNQGLFSWNTLLGSADQHSLCKLYNCHPLNNNLLCQTANKVEQIDNWICGFNPGLKCGEEENPCGFCEGRAAGCAPTDKEFSGIAHSIYFISTSEGQRYALKNVLAFKQIKIHISTCLPERQGRHLELTRCNFFAQLTLSKKVFCSGHKMQGCTVFAAAAL